jgi:RNA polymerase sigma factor (sigma-70 family)
VILSLHLDLIKDLPIVRPLTDDALLAAQQGDPAGFRVVYEDLAPAVLGYLVAKGVDDPEAVTQEVFLAIFGQLPSLEGGQPALRALIFSIAHARVVDHIRRAIRTPETTEYDPASDPRMSASAETVVLDSWENSGIALLLDQLHDDQREVILLRIVADLSVEQVATIMNRSVGAIKQLQRRGLNTLRDLITTRDYSKS